MGLVALGLPVFRIKLTLGFELLALRFLDLGVLWLRVARPGIDQYRVGVRKLSRVFSCGLAHRFRGSGV